MWFEVSELANGRGAASEPSCKRRLAGRGISPLFHELGVACSRDFHPRPPGPPKNEKALDEFEVRYNCPKCGTDLEEWEVDADEVCPYCGAYVDEYHILKDGSIVPP